MIKKLWLSIIAALVLAAVSGCASGGEKKEADTAPVQVTAEEEAAGIKERSAKEYFVTRTMQSIALANNITGTPVEQEVTVYLPPSYYDSDKRYPVVYYLHGYMESAMMFIFGNTDKLNEAFKNGAKEFIFVGVNGRNTLGGAFYENSPVSGNWEDYVVYEIVPYVDRNFRTINDSNSRGMCGFSMGGYGAYNIPFKHPDVFSSFITMSPGAIAAGDFPAALASWKGDTSFLIAYAQAFSPDKRNKPVYGNIPEGSGTRKDTAVLKDWENGYGNLDQKLDAYLALSKPLKAVKILYGETDYYGWIPRGCKYLSAGLTERGIEHSIESFPFGHMIHPMVIENYIVPFFNQNLEY